MFNLPVYPGENSTYNLQFRGPQVRCTSTSYNKTFPLEYQPPRDPTSVLSLVAPAFVSKWDWNLEWNRDSQDAPLYYVVKYLPLTWTASRTSTNATSYEVLLATAELSCKPYSMLFNVEISFPHGIQTVQYTTSDVELLSPMGIHPVLQVDLNLPKGAVYSEQNLELSAPVALLSLPANTQTLQDWNHRMHDLLPLANEWALLDALGLLIEDEIYLRTMSVSLDPGNPWCNESSISTNGTTFFDCGDWVSGHLVVMNTSCTSHVSLA
jgi:hypothetical protein